MIHKQVMGSTQNRQEAERREILPWKGGQALEWLPREAGGPPPLEVFKEWLSVAFKATVQLIWWCFIKGWTQWSRGPFQP